MSRRFLESLGLLCEYKRFAKSMRTPRFVQMYDRLPERIKKAAGEAYVRWRADPTSVEFRPLKGKQKIYWRITLSDGYRALGEEDGDDTIRWFWIGTHNAYDKAVGSLR